MAITFTPKNGSAFTIGTITGDLPGTFPNYSIGREIRRQDSLMIGNRYSIDITGVVLITEAASHMVKGLRHDKLLARQKKIVDQAIGKQGTLDITTYGGQTITFNDCNLIVATALEFDDGSGTQNAPYSFVFESYTGTGAIEPEAGKHPIPKHIESFEETWDVVALEGSVSASDITTPWRQYTITRTLSAQAVVGSIDASNNMTYIHARTFVEARAGDIGDPYVDQILDERKKEVTNVYDKAGGATYKGYNHIRQRNQSIAGGSYSITDTWTGSRFPNIVTMSLSYNKDSTAEFNTVEGSADIQGLDRGNPDSSSNPIKYTNAIEHLSAIKTALKGAAAGFYNDNNLGGGCANLNPDPLSESETHDKLNGSVSYSVTFNDRKVPSIPNALTQRVNITYSNEDGTNSVIVIIPVLEKADGPVIQDMSVTNEKKVSVSLDVVMKRCHRDDKPDGMAAVNIYKPAALNGPYQQAKTESWSPDSGQYNLSLEWVYI
jgi:hypothetical protein